MYIFLRLILYTAFFVNANYCKHTMCVCVRGTAMPWQKNRKDRAWIKRETSSDDDTSDDDIELDLRTQVPLGRAMQNGLDWQGRTVHHELVFRGDFFFGSFLGSWRRAGPITRANNKLLTNCVGRILHALPKDIHLLICEYVHYHW